MGIEQYSNELVGRQIYCVEVQSVVCGVVGRVFLYFDPLNRYHLCGELSAKIERLKAELARLKRYPKNRLRRYAPYFVLTVRAEGGLIMWWMVAKVEVLRRSKGYFMIFSTDRGVLAGEVLDHYRAKDGVEKLFVKAKVELEGNRIWVHSDVVADGKTFVIFVACIIRNFLLHKLSAYLVESSSSLRKAIDELSNIVLLSSQGTYRFAKTLSKKQKAILAAFMDDKDLDKALAAELSTLKP